MISTITLDTYKQQISSGDAFDLSDSFNGRVGDEQVPLVVHFKERGLANRFEDGLVPFITGFVGCLDENSQVTAETGEAVSYVGSSDDVVGLGRVKMNLPGNMFPQEGYFYGFLGLQNADGKRVTTFNVWFHVYNGNPDMFVNKAPFRTELQKLLDAVQLLINDADGDLNKWKQKLTDLFTTLSAQGANTETLLTTLQAQIKQSNLFTQGQMDGLIGTLSDFKPAGANLIDKLNNEFSDRGVNIEWFGAIGDGVTDDTNAINKGIALGYPIIFEPGKNYSVKELTLPEGTVIEGNNATLNINPDKANNTLGINSGTNIRNLKINCLTEDLEWSRIDFTNKSNIELDNLTITGFRHKSDAPNAWGIYLDHSSNIKIKNCKFDNNSQSDIAIVEGCSDILIDNCRGLNDKFYIDVEPNNANDDVVNIVINQCELSKLSLINPVITKPMGKRISVNNSHVKLLDYCGFDISFNDSKIDAVNPSLIPNSNNVSGGTIKLNGALGLSANLMTDPHIQSYATVAKSGAKWVALKGDLNSSTGTTRFEDENGSLTRIGTRSDTLGQLVLSPEMRYKDQFYLNQKYPVVEGDTFMLTLVGEADYPIKSTWPSMNALFYFYDATDNVISSIAVSLLKAEIGGAADYAPRSAFIKVPTGAIKMTCGIGNCVVAQSMAHVYIGTVALQRLTNAMNSVQLEALPVGSTRVMYSAAMPSAAYGWGHYQAGDICYNSNPTSGADYGWICIESGYPGTWQSLGKL
ncbi:glycosyl hydrolase family 28-related protein [Lactiplantibacillus plantarum]|uniref:glycosyl hydrolase family 28-related protein n=1 Tax=Lactiplantibacillus plantarum TaxID=1590 RepID=UPI003C147097